MPRKCDPTLRQRIIEEAEHLIHLRGYHCTSLDEIAARCRMTKANLFHHFKSKEDLGLAVVDFKIACYRCGNLAKLSAAPDPHEAVAGLFRAAAGFFRGNGCRAGCFVGNIALEMSDINDRFRRRVSDFFEEWVSSLEARLRRDRTRGLLGRNIDPRTAAEAILALYEGAIMLARSQRDPAVFDRVGREACRILERSRAEKEDGDQPPRRGISAMAGGRHQPKMPSKGG